MPVYGSRRMTAQLRREGYTVNRKRVQRLILNPLNEQPKRFNGVDDVRRL